MNRDVAARIIRYQAETASRLFVEVGANWSGFIADAAVAVTDALRAGGFLYTCGNGGSAADAQHIACELSGKFYLKRAGLPATALTTNSSAITAIGNDFDFDEVFSRQLEGVARKGDVLLAITTSGGSRNVVKAVEVARQRGMIVIGLTGGRGDEFAETCDLCLVVPSEDTPRIQEAHIFAGHMICQLVESAIFGSDE